MDISYQTCDVSTSAKSATINYLKSTSKGKIANKLQILNVKPHKMLILYLYVQINNRFRYLWGHKKVKIVVKIILAAEMLTLEEALESCFKIKSILTEWQHPLADTINSNKSPQKKFESWWLHNQKKYRRT